MSWEDVLKKVSIDMGDALDSCCEVARGEMIEVLIYQMQILRVKF